ncbi:MAG: hypothetical protein ACFBRM_00485, partial [Pikeienuella sp.]
MRPNWPIAQRLSLVAFAALLAGCAAFEVAPPEPEQMADATEVCAALPGDPDDETDGGIGGTGILGAVTGFGSLHINGLRVLHLPDAEVASPLGSAPVESVEVGEVLIARAAMAEGRLCAIDLARYYPLVGPIGEIDAEAGELRVMDRRVLIMPDTVFALDDIEDGGLGGTGLAGSGLDDGGLGGTGLAGSGLDDGGLGGTGLAALQPGTRVAVSGIWSEEGVVATHVRRIGRDGPDSLAGPIGRDAAGGVTVGGVPVRLTGDAADEGVGDALSLSVRGRFDNGRFRVARIARGFDGPFARWVRKLSIQGVPSRRSGKAVLAGHPEVGVRDADFGRLGVFEGNVTESAESGVGTAGAPRGVLGRAADALSRVDVSQAIDGLRDRIDAAVDAIGERTETETRQGPISDALGRFGEGRDRGNDRGIFGGDGFGGRGPFGGDGPLGGDGLGGDGPFGGDGPLGGDGLGGRGPLGGDGRVGAGGQGRAGRLVG